MFLPTNASRPVCGRTNGFRPRIEFQKDALRPALCQPPSWVDKGGNTQTGSQSPQRRKTVLAFLAGTGRLSRLKILPYSRQRVPVVRGREASLKAATGKPG